MATNTNQIIHFIISGLQTLRHLHVHDVLPPDVGVQRDGLLLRDYLPDGWLHHRPERVEHHRGCGPPGVLLRRPGRGVAAGEEGHPGPLHIRHVSVPHVPRCLLLSQGAERHDQHHHGVPGGAREQRPGVVAPCIGHRVLVPRQYRIWNPHMGGHGRAAPA